MSMYPPSTWDEDTYSAGTTAHMKVWVYCSFQDIHGEFCRNLGDTLCNKNKIHIRMQKSKQNIYPICSNFIPASMQISLNQAIKLSIKLWEWLVVTGSGNRADWPEWDKIGALHHWNPLCEYTWYSRAYVGDNCQKICPYGKIYGECSDSAENEGFGRINLNCPLQNWNSTKWNYKERQQIAKRKEFSGEFLSRLKTLKGE